jgi:nucleoporin NDC1
MEPATLSATPTLALVSGTTASADHLRFSAYAGLARLAADDTPAGASARTQLFADQKYSPSMWAVLVREELLVLGTDYQRLLGRGKLPVKCMFDRSFYVCRTLFIMFLL